MRTRSSAGRTARLLLVALLLAGGWGHHRLARQAWADEPRAGKEAGDAKAPKKRSEPRGRLPAFFGEVISTEQRDKIYDLQAKYSAQIAKLHDEITQLEETREKEVMGVLTPEQAAKVKALQDEAKAKRAAAGGRKKAETATAGNGESR